MEDCLLFDIMGDFGFFKSYYTTSSPLTFEIPPKTCLTGLIGAILGLSFKERYDLFNSQIAIRINKKVKKIGLGINWLNTKSRSSKITENTKKWLKILNLPPDAKVAAYTGLEWPGQSPHTQAKLEILVRPSYRVYYPNSNPKFDELCELIKSHKSYFTPFLGSSEFICNFSFVDIGEVEKKILKNQWIQVHSIIPISTDEQAPNIELNLDKNPLIKIVNVPNKMKEDRIVTEYIKIFYNPSGEIITIKAQNYTEVKYKNGMTENVIFF